MGDAEMSNKDRKQTWFNREGSEKRFLPAKSLIFIAIITLFTCFEFTRDNFSLQLARWQIHGFNILAVVLLSSAVIWLFKRYERLLLVDMEKLKTTVQEKSLNLSDVNVQLRQEIAKHGQVSEELQAERKRLYTLLDGLPAYVYLQKADHQITFVNRMFTERFGAPEGKPCHKVLHNRPTPCPGCHVDKLFINLTPKEWEWKHEEGNIYQTYAYPFTDPDGTLLILNLGLDITDRYHTREALQCSNEALATANEELTASNEEILATNEELTSMTDELSCQVRKLENNQQELFRLNRQLQDIIDFLPDATFVLDQEKKVIAWNRAMEKMTGVAKKEVLGRGEWAYVKPFYCEDQPVLIDLLEHYVPGEDYGYQRLDLHDHKLTAETYIPSMDEGRGAYLWAVAAPLFNQAGERAGAIQTIRDITRLRRAEEEGQRQRELFRQLFTNSPQGIALVDCNNKIVQVNEGFEKLFLYQKEEALGQSINDLVLPEHLIHQGDHVFNKIMSGNPVEIDCVRRRKDGSLVNVLLLGYPVIINGQTFGRFVTYSDITVRKQAEEQLKYYSMHDSLTGLYNRTYFEEEMIRSKDQRYAPVGIIMCDVDGLKIVNDTLGHSTGDNILIVVADVIKHTLLNGQVFARVGGDEFAVLAPNSDYAAMEKVCHDISLAVDKYNQINSNLPISISLGFSVSTDHDGSLEDTLKQADNNMYREKLLRSKSARSAIVQTLMKALEARDFITEGHAERLLRLVSGVAGAIGLSEHNITELSLLAQFHDIGKVGIPDRILFKPGPLTPEEVAEMRRHCEIGHRIAQSAPDLVLISDWILKHHEWWNGQGYPFGLKEDEIPLECRILAIADAYDAMVSYRPYRQAMTHEQALTELNRCAGTQFDPQLVEVYVKMLDNPENLLGELYS
jgi:diguanylate cyclase (GGDEF)-like protein/PAS domain S-box-containing protein